MKELTVLVTGGGAPGIMGTLYSLKRNWDGRNIKTVCVDMNPNVVGKYLCDSFHPVPSGKDERFLHELMNVCNKENVDVLLPQVTNELIKLARNRKEFESAGTVIAVSSENAIKTANDKYNLVKLAKKEGVPYPEFILVEEWDKMERAAEKLGFPFVVKPPEGSGMRGFRVVYDKIDLKNAFYSEKPNNTKITMEQLHEIIGDYFPPLLAMEYLPGEEYTVDVLSSRDNVHAVIPRKRDRIRSGITFAGTAEKKDDIIEYTERLTRSIGLEYAHGFQFKYSAEGIPKLLESNPRIQGTMVLSTVANANVIYGAVKIAMDENISEFKVRWGSHLLRYWGAIGISEEEVYRI